MCAGGPFLDPTNSNSYVFHQKTNDNSAQPFAPDQGVGMVWPFGMENWCNLQGQYVHIVAD